METQRKPFQGVWNIIRFNWHFYALSGVLAFLLLLFYFIGFSIHPYYTLLPAIGLLIITVTSLLVSAYVYDISNLYSLPWMNSLLCKPPETIVNVNAGFDETSVLLNQKFPEANLIVLDFYDPEKHTEVSIKRARKAYPPYPNTISTQTHRIEVKGASVDLICAILSAHEIRDSKERERFFKELKRILKPEGQIFVTEHLRGFPNFLAYTIGFFHFHSKNTWLETFKSANLMVSKEVKTTHFISTFILEHAATS